MLAEWRNYNTQLRNYKEWMGNNMTFILLFLITSISLLTFIFIKAISFSLKSVLTKSPSLDTDEITETHEGAILKA